MQGDPPSVTVLPAAADELVRQADAHGVLPAVLRHFPPFHDDPAFAVARSEATLRYRTALSVALMLRQHANALIEAMADLPVAVIKGPVFARLIYPDAGLRPFGDIDLLAAPDALPEVGQRLEAHGFRLAEDDGRASPQEWKWVHREAGAIMIEVQTDLVHASSLRRSMSVIHDTIAGKAETPAVQLLIAVVHGSLGAHFEQLRNLVDICQAARNMTADDAAGFERLVECTGSRFAARVGLQLAGAVLAEPRCLEIAAALGPVRHAGLAGLLLDRSVVMSTMTPYRWIHAWRRQAFRQLLKR